MMKKKPSVLLALVMVAALVLSACGGGGASSAPASTAPAEPVSRAQPAAAEPAKSADFAVTFSNGTDYNFQELYVSPTASGDWGADHLGSTNILKKNGSFEITLPSYEYDSFDILVIDEDDDEYQFTRATLTSGCEVMITFEEGGLAATSFFADGGQETVYGTLNGESMDSAGGNDAAGTTADGAANYDAANFEPNGNDTAGRFSFAVYNESDYDIYAIYMGILNAGSEYDLDILPAILAAGDDTVVSGQVSQGDWMNTEWTLYIEDVDGDTSASFDVFNPWTISYVDIYWDGNNGGYVCDFYY